MNLKWEYDMTHGIFYSPYLPIIRDTWNIYGWVCRNLNQFSLWTKSELYSSKFRTFVVPLLTTYAAVALNMFQPWPRICILVYLWFSVLTMPLYQMIYDLFVSDYKSKSITKNRWCCRQWIYDYIEHSMNLAATLRWKETSTALKE